MVSRKLVGKLSQKDKTKTEKKILKHSKFDKL